MNSAVQPERDNPHSRVARNGAVSLAAQATRFVVYFAAAVVLAHRLSPADFGIFGIAFAFTGFLEIAKDGGLVVPVVQTDFISEPQLNALFWTNAAVGTALTLLSLAAAPLVAHIYREPRLTAAIRILALTFLAGGISTQHRALLRRHSRFIVLGVCETTALTAGCAVAIVAALRGAGFRSLVWLFVTMEITQTLMTFAASGWKPGWPPSVRTGTRGAPIRPLLRFGGLMMAFDFLGYMNLKFDNLVVAWYLGPAALGFYDKAYQFLLLPVNQIGNPVTSVAHSALSRARPDPDRYRDLFDRLLLIATGLGMPLIAFLLANTRAIVTLVLGTSWLPSVPIFVALSPAACLMTITASMGWLFLSLGRAARQLRWSVLTSALTIAAYFIGVRWGAVGVAGCLSVSRILAFVPTLRYTCRGTPVRWTRILVISAWPALASLAALAVSLATGSAVPATTLWTATLWSLVRNALLFIAVYIVAWIALPGGRAFLRRHLPSAKMLFER